MLYVIKYVEYDHLYEGGLLVGLLTTVLVLSWSKSPDRPIESLSGIVARTRDSRKVDIELLFAA